MDNPEKVYIVYLPDVKPTFERIVQLKVYCRQNFAELEGIYYVNSFAGGRPGGIELIMVSDDRPDWICQIEPNASICEAVNLMDGFMMPLRYES